MSIQFDAQIRHGELKLPPTFAATHWLRTAKQTDRRTKRITVDVIFPKDNIKNLKVDGKDSDIRLLFDKPLLESLHLQDGDRLIFSCDNAQRLLEVSAIHNEYQMAMVDTRMGRAYNCFLHYIPVGYQNFVDDIINVSGDGNCGFHCVLEETTGVSCVAENVTELRQRVFDELNENYELYREAMGLTEDIHKKIFDRYINSVNTTDDWMDISLPFVISTVLNIPIMMLVISGTSLYFPQRSTPEEAKGPLICMAYVNGNHFVRVKLKPDCPSPEVNTVYTLPNNKNDQWTEKLVQEGLLSLLQFNKEGEVRGSNAGPNLGDGSSGQGVKVEGGKRIDNKLEQPHSPPRQGVDIELEQQPQEPQQIQRRRNAHGQIPQKRSLPERSRNKPVTYVDIDCLKLQEKKRNAKKKKVEDKNVDPKVSENLQAKKRNAKKKKVEDKNVEEKKKVDPKVSESSSRILPPLTEGEGSVRPRDGTSVNSSDSEDEGERSVMPKVDTAYVNSSDSENEGGRSVKHRDGTTSRLKFTEGDSGFKKEDRQNRKAVERSEDSKSVSTTLSERKKIDDTIRPIIQQLSEYFELEDEVEGHSLKTFEELIEKKGKKWRVPKARMIVELLKTF